ncbi:MULTISPECIES: LysR family transcriptional regulator [Paraburkholderia]|uniref:LysR family transcriptional regulator n=1 Tax=Paraburkholderia TaxID=1822464 RepID=UPI00224FFFFF|nr:MULTISPECIES: LysR family transcriptional regulator [Paraburkholderia]MCX4160033.1 LysR family transcriptional regulator [Paraburkholderia megapolitana]MDN7155533.1 LysR family transcriptional regulator [Paraburkholderia sp. CHISQ3]MDQ6492577.1 LysR family transcriptional regulator [Paraburkholderia megapolitana]
MESQFIEYFLRVAELGSINKAAADLRLSQPALSRHIGQLEHQLRATLFTRTKGGVRLTEAGELLQERARPIIRQLSSLVEQVGDRAAGQLSLGVAPSWRHLFTTKFIQRLVAQYPGVRLRIHEGVSHELREAMHAGMLDLAIVPFEGSPPQGYVHKPLVREPLILVGAKDSGLRPDKPVPLSRLDNRKLALASRQNVIRTTIENSMARRNLQFNLLFELDAMHLSMELASQGIADTVSPCCAVSGNAYWEDSISWSPIRGLHMTWALCENSARSHSPAVSEGRRLVLDVVDEIIQSNSWFDAERLKKL